MDFFERAHVPKKDSLKKESKSEETVKKQLKQMLYGYKKSDNELIKNSANVKTEYNNPLICFDDSTSVSGFSDLNLTDSSIDGGLTQRTLDSIQTNSGDNEINLSSELKDDTIDSLESISEYNDDLQSLSEDTPEITEESASEDSNDLSFITSLVEISEVDSKSSEEFDADGALASRILERLGEKEKKTKSVGKKRKIEQTEKVQDSAKQKDKKKGKIDKPEEIYGNIKNICSSEQVGNTESIEHYSNNSYVDSISSLNVSSPFVSIIASDMAEQSLNEVLGDYRHPTVKNLPSDKQTVIYTTNNTDGFDAGNVSLSQVQIEEDNDSLIPELDEDLTIEELSLDTDLEMTIEPQSGSTSVYDDTLRSETFEKDSSLQNEYINPVKVHYGKKCCVFVLKHPVELYVHGKVKSKALGGTMETFGYTLKSEWCDLYAPNYNFANCLKTVKIPNVYYGLFSQLTLCGLSVAESEEIVTTIGEYDGIICLKSLNSRGMDFVENNFTAVDLFSKPSKNIENSLRKASEVLGCSFYLTKPLRCLEVSPYWEEAVKCGLQKRSRGLVCGGKGTGKSTFLKYYVNRLLAQGPVLVIDLDPGQREFSVAGNVSANVVNKPLLGPNFTHLQMPDKMYNVGMISVMDNPARYAEALNALFLDCNDTEELKNMPWIVNTMGMSNDMGLRFLTLAILHTEPTFVLQIDSKNAKKRFEYNMYPHITNKLYLEEYQNDYIFTEVSYPDNLNYQLIVSNHVEGSVRNCSLAPRDERYLNYLAYFGQLMDRHNGEFLGIVPYEVNLKDLNVCVNVKVIRENIKEVINGKIIALCQMESDKTNGVFSLDDNHFVLPCYGYGLIRGIDFQKEILYMITPLAADKLSLVNTLVYCDWVPELRGQERQVPVGAVLPYRTATQYSHRRLMFSPRRRFNPLQLLKMTRNT